MGDEKRKVTKVLRASLRGLRLHSFLSPQHRQLHQDIHRRLYFFDAGPLQGRVRVVFTGGEIGRRQTEGGVQ
jgi:hypothetical protein